MILNAWNIITASSNLFSKYPRFLFSLQREIQNSKLQSLVLFFVYLKDVRTDGGV